jgi:hypothetical protein
MRLRELVLAVTVVALAFCTTAQARDRDPIIGTWTWFDGKETHLTDGNKIRRDGNKVGDWYKGKFKHNGARYTYKLVWTSGYTDYLNLAKKNNHLTGVNNEGSKITGDRK